MNLVSKSEITYQKIESPQINSNNILIDNGGILTFDEKDGQIISSNGASGWPYTVGINSKLENGKIYDLSNITSDLDLSNLSFDGNETIIQTAEVWFTFGDTVYDITWPSNLIWIDTVDGTMPRLFSNQNYRISIRKEINHLVASISYSFSNSL